MNSLPIACIPTLVDNDPRVGKTGEIIYCGIVDRISSVHRFMNGKEMVVFAGGAQAYSCYVEVMEDQ